MVATAEQHPSRRLALNGLRMASAREGEDHVIALTGELDLATVAPIERELQDAEVGDWTRMVLDLRGVSFLDSTGLHLLTRAHKRASARGRQLEVVLTPGPVRRVLEVSGVLDILGRSQEAAAA